MEEVSVNHVRYIFFKLEVLVRLYFAFVNVKNDNLLLKFIFHSLNKILSIAHKKLKMINDQRFSG
jgi:hypothetical protein